MKPFFIKIAIFRRGKMGNELNGKLKERQPNFDANGGYKQDALPEVYAYYKAYVATGKFPYLNHVVAHIAEHEEIDDGLLDYLKTEVYLAADQARREEKAQYKDRMLKDGWTELNTETAKSITGKIKVEALGQGPILNFRLSGTFKVFINENGFAYLMKPRATRRGILISNLSDAFFKA
jgi:hypothetical protein